MALLPSGLPQREHGHNTNCHDWTTSDSIQPSISVVPTTGCSNWCLTDQVIKKNHGIIPRKSKIYRHLLKE
jgi:hypothetical protein